MKKLVRFSKNFISIIDLYFYKEIIPNYFFGVLFFTFILMLNELFFLARYYIEYNVPFKQVMLLLVNLLPFLLSYSIPIGVLPAYLLSVGRLSQDSEIIAMKSCGISTMRIVRGGLIFGLLITIFSFNLMDGVVVPANLNYIRIRAKIMSQKPAVELKERSFMEIGGYKISFEKMINESGIDVLYNIHVIDIRGRKTIEAEKGRFFTDTENPEHYILKFMNGSISEVVKDQDKDGKVTEHFFVSSFRYLVINVYVSLPQDVYNKSPDTMNIKELKESIKNKASGSYQMIETITKDREKLMKDVETYRKKLKLAKKGINVDLDSEEIEKYESQIHFLYEQIKSVDKNISKFKNNLPSYYIMKLHEKYALPFASFVFALISMSIGMYSSRSGRGEGLGLSIIIMLIFYGMKLGSENLIIKKILPPYAEWFSPGIMFIIGTYLMIKKIRE